MEHVVYHTSAREKLTYFNTEPKIYRSTEVISSVDYDSSAFVRFLEENFNAHYSLTLAFGINAYIQIIFFKTEEEGDFTKEEIDEKLQDILDFADIGDFVNQPVKTYSSGMFVRLAFAVAIPEILGRAKIVAGRSSKFLEAYIVAAIIYFVICTICQFALDYIEKRNGKYTRRK